MAGKVGLAVGRALSQGSGLGASVPLHVGLSMGSLGFLTEL